MKLTFFIYCASLLEAIILQLMILAQKLSQWPQKTMMCRYLCAKKSSKIQNEQMIPIISFHEHMILNNIFFCWFQAYLFDGYWEDIGTIKSFFEANLALTDQVYFLVDIISIYNISVQDNYVIYYLCSPPTSIFTIL